jgi:hypothetical protein
MYTATSRTALAGASLICFAAAILLMPADARSQAAGSFRDPLAGPALRLATPPALVAAERDAFAPRAAPDADARMPLSAPLPALPPRAIGSAVPLAAQLAPLRVTAIATGAQPTAIVERTGEPPRVVTAGDPIDGTTVQSIGDDVVVLTNGRRLSLEPR